MSNLYQAGNSGNRVSRVSRAFTVLLFGLTFAGLSACSSTAPATEDTSTQAPVEITSPVPSWYNDAQAGEISDGQVSGYGRAVGVDAQLALENARSLAIDNLNYWIDLKLEEGRQQGAPENSAYGDSDFIRELRATLAFYAAGVIENLTYQADTYQDGGVVYGVVRADLTTEELLNWVERVKTRITEDHQQAWSELVQSQLVDTALNQE